GPDGPQRGYGGGEVTDAEGTQDQDHGYEDSCSAATTRSRTGHPAGWVSANSTAAATWAGSLRIASGPGLYRSSRSSKNLVRIPPGISSVTPTCPASSAGRQPAE